MSVPATYRSQRSGQDGGLQIASGNGKSPSSAPLLAAALNALDVSIAIIDERGMIVAVNSAWRRYAHEDGMRWSRYGIGYNYLSVLDSASRYDENLAEIALEIRRVLSGTAHSYRAEYPCQTPGGCHYVQQVTAFDFAGERHAIISHEKITLQKLNEAELRAARETAEAALHEEEARRAAAEHRQRIAEAVADLLSIAGSGVHLQDALQGMVERIRETLGSQAAAIYSAAERWDRLVLVAGCGLLGDPGTKAETTVDRSILAQALADQRGVAVMDTGQHRTGPLSKAAASELQADYQGLLVTPIQLKDRLYGYLIVFYAAAHEFGQDHVEIAHVFAQQITVALGNAELRSHAERVAITNERNRLARDLHDAVTQTLFAASVVAEALPRVWERDPVEGRRALEELRIWTRGALAEMRTLLMELRPAALIEKPLPDLIRQLSEAAATQLLIPVVCDSTADTEPPTEVKLSLYRIAQEALNNMVKHSCASHVEIRYLAQAQGVQLAILDDGRGFEIDALSSGQMGLGIMRERARQIGARLNIRSAPGAGTEVHVEWRPRGRKNLYE